MIWIIISICVLFLFELGVFMYFEKHLKCSKVIEKWLQSDNRKESIKKVTAIVNNVNSLDRTSTAHNMISNVITGEVDKFKSTHIKTDEWVVEMMREDLTRDTSVIYLLKKCQLLERELNRYR
jgi:hypothetical protein